MVEETGLPPINFETLVGRAVIDNTAFAGSMRLCEPELPEHKEFNRRWPSHRQIDERSVMEILTAIVLYDRLLLERSSLAKDPPRDAIEEDSWVGQMKKKLRPEVANLFSEKR